METKGILILAIVKKYLSDNLEVGFMIHTAAHLQGVTGLFCLHFFIDFISLIFKHSRWCHHEIIRATAKPCSVHSDTFA